MDKERFLYKELTHNVIGAAMEVHNILGCGFLEDVYEEAFCYELKLRRINYVRQKEIEIYY